jgi:hypothetical protein
MTPASTSTRNTNDPGAGHANAGDFGMTIEIKVPEDQLFCRCGRPVRNYDLRHENSGAQLICQGCHTTLMVICVEEWVEG